ncbi:MAG: response regulator [Candidatus Uhrbacteria bacterium]
MNKKKIYKILLVEDNPAMSKVYRNRLVSEGFEVITAEDGEQGIDKIRSEKPELVLLDLIMPKIDGFGVLEEIRKDKKYNKIPIIVLSNLGQASDLEKAKKLGATDYLIKADFSLVDVVKRVRQHLN